MKQILMAIADLTAWMATFPYQIYRMCIIGCKTCGSPLVQRHSNLCEECEKTKRIRYGM